MKVSIEISGEEKPLPLFTSSLSLKMLSFNQLVVGRFYLMISSTERFPIFFSTMEKDFFAQERLADELVTHLSKHYPAMLTPNLSICLVKVIGYDEKGTPVVLTHEGHSSPIFIVDDELFERRICH